MAEEEDRSNGGYSFKSEDGWYMVRCHKCQRENWAMAVASGRCAWCDFDRNNEVIEE